MGDPQPPGAATAATTTTAAAVATAGTPPESPAGPFQHVPLPEGGPSIELALIPAGPFLMGDVLDRSPERDTRPVHEVELDAYYIARTTVTNAQFAWFVSRTGYRTTREQAGYPEQWRHYALPGRERYPVICINWIDAAAFAVWAGLRLPTEAEWEKAARGGLEGADYPWGNAQPHEDATARDRCNWRGASYKPGLVPLNEAGWGLTPVGSYPPNGYGLYDTSGNVWEWVADLYSDRYYETSPRRNPLGPEVDSNNRYSPLVRWQDDDHLRINPQAYRAIRGGAWDNNIFGLRCCERIFARALSHNKSTVSGFRVASSG
ncbi:MAG TPA: SUMF1/EgtB/PvdO family nonheme iron enzyme [Chloroflexota bacterium]|nr:SUMF1/EgtB/PvdO family nonheme iron enzyme [Chloroflexota bacterium]